MADRILAAMDYMDTHAKTMPTKLKQRALGDIDGKYSVVEPLLEVSYYPAIKNELSLSGVRKTNPSNDRSPEDIVEEDRERMVQSAERARSAPAPFNDSNMTSSTRPMTSSSWVTGGSREVDRHMHHSILTTSSHASIKRLAFTSPAVKVGPADVRDDIMDEIVNKTLVFHRNNIKSQSAPPTGRVTSGLPKSAGTQSTRWVESPKRARTSFRRRRRGAKSWEKNPGPFMTVKVTGKDLWVVSNSTPTSYFNNKKDDGLREASGMSGTKVAKWEETADSLPKAEQMSPPRHERMLGAPPQFAPSIHWLRYDPSSPPKKPPVLTPFRDGRYYNVESDLSKKVSEHLDASPGVRIARNGEVLAHSMKLESVDESDPESAKESESDGSDIDVASLIPAKLAAKIKKHYGTPEDESEDDYGEEDDAQESEDEKNKGETEKNLLLNGNEDDSEDEALKNGEEMSPKTEKDENDSGHDSEEASDLSSMSSNDDKGSSEDRSHTNEKQNGPLLTKDSLALLTKLAGHDPTNPLVEDSNASATSFEGSLESYELNDFLEQNGIELDSPRITNGHVDQDDVWRILENATPNFWITKSKQQKLAILKRLRRQRKSEQIASTGESLKSGKTREDNTSEIILPLCWEDEVKKSNTKVVQVRSGVTAPPKQSSNTTLPVVFHKAPRQDVLPTATVTSPFTPSMSWAKTRPRSASSQQPAERVTFGFNTTRGSRAPVSTPRSNRSLRTKSASAGSYSTPSSVRSHDASHSLVSGNDIRQSLDLADLLRVTPDSFPAKTPQVATRTHVVQREHVTVVHDDVSEAEMQSVRKTADESMKNRGERDHNESKTSSITASRLSVNTVERKDRVPAPVGTLNLVGIDSDATTNDTTTFSSQRPCDIRSSFTTPYNTPKTPIIHHSVALAPKTSARGQHSDSIRLGIEADNERSGEGVREVQLSSKPILVAQQEHQGSSARTSLSARGKPGLSSVPLTHNRLKSGSSRGTHGYHGVTGPRPMKALPTVQTTISNGGGDQSLSMPAVQPSAPSVGNGIPSKTADFIQITQSLHISDRSRTQGEIHAVTGNKMYDSYMRELSAHSASELDERNDTRNLIVGRGLGGTSGKPSGFSLPRTVKKNLPYRQSQHSQSVSTFSQQGGRRSGLVMTSHDKSQKVGPFGLGVKGDQVRLNIDKNIHIIYRDLGLLKNGGGGAKVDQPNISPGRSHLSSARSRATLREDSVISIPTASEQSVANAPHIKPTGTSSQGSGTPEEAKTKRPSSSNPSVTVQDSETQWSSRSVKFDDDEKQRTRQILSESSETAVRTESKPGIESPADKERTNGAKQAESNSQEMATEKSDITVKDSTKESFSPVSERSLTRGISRSSDAVSASESNVSVVSQPQTVVQRSASETLLDRLAEMGDRDESSDATEDEVDEPDDADVKGVTRVTVNIPTKTEAIS